MVILRQEQRGGLKLYLLAQGWRLARVLSEARVYCSRGVTLGKSVVKRSPLNERR